MRTIILVLAIVLVASYARAEDKGYFNCLRYGMTDAQKDEVSAWFRSDGVANCCDLSDGMPGWAEDRSDGVYIAPREITLPIAEACRDHPEIPLGDPPKDHAAWIKGDTGRTLHKNNPVGVVVVWWLSSWSADAQRVLWLPRCVANLVRG